MSRRELLALAALGLIAGPAGQTGGTSRAGQVRGGRVVVWSISPALTTVQTKGVRARRVPEPERILLIESQIRSSSQARSSFRREL